VRREKRNAILFVVFLACRKKTIDPRKPRLLAMISVKNYWNTVQLGNLVYVLGTCDASSDGGHVVGVVDRLSGNELSTSLGEGNHDWPSILGGSLHARIDRVGADNVDSGDSISVLLGVVKKVDKSLTSDNTGLDRSRELSESLRLKKNKFT
jgi:hypothetical protein